MQEKKIYLLHATFLFEQCFHRRGRKLEAVQLCILSMRSTSIINIFLFSVSDFNHQLSKIHEQFAEDSAQLVETFRKKTSDILNEG